MNIEQVVALAGDGRLRDDSECSRELRSFLSEAPTAALRKFADHCLAASFQKSGQILQDIVNELGRRLDFSVTNGRYQGTSNAIGNDGLWLDPDGHALVVEVKTTDAYRIPLDTIAHYRDRHVLAGTIRAPHAMLVVVGREDTGELEAQVRGSRHAWDMRLISVDALFRLVELRESTEEEATARKIRGILRPAEFTRLDGLIDVLFTAAKDVEERVAEPAVTSSDEAEHDSGWQFTAPDQLATKRDAIITAVSAQLGRALVKRSRATFWDTSKGVRAVCTISKRYERPGPVAYWYAFHPSWDAFLAAGETAVFILGGMDIDQCFVLPHTLLRQHLSELNTTEKDDQTAYWHIKILEPNPGLFSLQMPKSGHHVPLARYQLSLVGGDAGLTQRSKSTPSLRSEEPGPATTSERSRPTARERGIESRIRAPLPVDLPEALRQILRVVSLVRSSGMPRVEATLCAAEEFDVTRETIGDKYGRQLGISTATFDTLLEVPDLSSLQGLLAKRFPKYEEVVAGYLLEVRRTPAS